MQTEAKNYGDKKNQIFIILYVPWTYENLLSKK